MTSPSDQIAHPANEVAGRKNIYLQLRDRIVQWHYPPGFHLGEKTLCEEFEVSRVPIREALRALAAEGFVDKVPNQGCFVKQLNVKETIELFEVRLALELHIGEMLTERGLPRDWVLTQRNQWQSMLQPSVEHLDVSAFVAADTDFHIGLAHACGNLSIARMVEEVSERLRFIKLSIDTTPERLKETANEHLRILDAIEQKDAAAVRSAIKGNIDHSSSRVELAISRALLSAHTITR